MLHAKKMDIPHGYFGNGVSIKDFFKTIPRSFLNIKFLEYTYCGSTTGYVVISGFSKPPQKLPTTNDLRKSASTFTEGSRREKFMSAISCCFDYVYQNVNSSIKTIVLLLKQEDNLEG